MDKALERAIRQSGGVTALAATLTKRGHKITKAAISQWRRCPPKRVLEVERASRVSRYALRPDIFGHK